MRYNDIPQQSLSSITEGLRDLATAMNSVLDFVGSETSNAKLKVDQAGRIIIGDADNNNGNLLVNGKIGVGVNSVPDGISLVTQQGIKFQGKRFEVNVSQPTSGNYNQGDIVWNSDPVHYVGWVCVRSGTPGEWKPFGKIDETEGQ